MTDIEMIGWTFLAGAVTGLCLTHAVFCFRRWAEERAFQKAWRAYEEAKAERH